MGSKKLKAIAVRGTKSIPVADAEGLKKLTKSMVTECLTNKSLVYFSKYGQAGLVDVLNESGILPTKNFQNQNHPDDGPVYMPLPEPSL